MKKIVLITGGSEGLGKAIASTFSKDHTVVILSNHKDTLSDAMKELQVDGYFCDITDPTQINKVVDAIIEKYSRIDTLVNNAGIITAGELDDTDEAAIAKVLMVNTLGTIYMTKSVLPIMKKQQSGKIINIDSTDGLETKIERSVYIASKWSITGFTKALRKELQKYNIAVSGVYPGLMSTNLFKSAGVSRDLTCAMGPDDVAKVIEFIHSFDCLVFEQVVFRDLKAEIF